MLCRADLGRPCRQAKCPTPLSPCGPNVLSASTLGRCRPPACSQAELSVDANPSFFSSTGARAWPCLLLADHCVWPGSASLKDRKSVGSGKSVAVRVDLGGRRIIKKKHKELS